jgi:hypothetical protein
LATGNHSNADVRRALCEGFGRTNRHQRHGLEKFVTGFAAWLPSANRWGICGRHARPSQLAAAVVEAEPLSEEKIKEMQRRLDENVDAVRR